MSLDDLKRLRISEPHTPSARGARRATLLLCAGCVAAGFVMARMLTHMTNSAPATVATVVAMPAAGAGSAQFTAGGWIEAATPQYPLHIVARLSERLEELRVHQGQDVKPGEVLARLYDKDQRDHLSAVQAEFTAAQTNLAMLVAGYRSQDIASARAHAHETAERLDLAATRLNRNSNLWQQQVVSKDEYDNAHALHQYASAEHEAALAELNKMQAGFRAEEVAQARAAVDRLTAEASLARHGVEYCTLAAPELGRPLRVLKTYRAVGQWINAEKEDMPTIVSLYDPTRMQMRVDVPQASVRTVAVNAPVIIVTEANRGHQYHGTVIRVEPLADIAKNTITTRVRIDDPDDMLFPEMVAQATFMSGAQTNHVETGLSVPATALVERDGSACVFVVENCRAHRRTVSVGTRTASQVTVTSGLQSGQRVIANAAGVRDGQAVVEE